MAVQPDSLELVYLRHHATVRNALRLLGVEPSSLDDAVQDVFAVFHRRVADYDRRRSITNWLWGIARGVASGYRRSARRRARLHGALERDASPLVDPAHHLEACAAIDSLLAHLDARDCAIVILAELEGRTGSEIARHLGMNVNTVYARLRTARSALRAATRERSRSKRWAIATWWTELWSPAATWIVPGLALVFANALIVEKPKMLATAGSSPLRTVRPPSQLMVHDTKVSVSGQGPDESPSDQEHSMNPILPLVLLAVSSGAPAPNTPNGTDQDADEAAVRGELDGMRWLVFGEDDVEGGIDRPLEQLVPHRRPAKGGSLLDIRTHFVPELIRHGNDL